MGLLDQVLGGLLGQQSGGMGGGFTQSGDRQDDMRQGGFGQGGLGQGGTSPIMMALMALLSSGALGRGGAGGGLGGLLGGLTGQGGQSGGMGGIGGLLERFQEAGHGHIANSWVGPGQNHQVTPDQLADALGDDRVEDLSRQSGLPRGQLLSELSRVLPEAVDKMTPDGRLPNDDEMARW